ncbi:hypothetical protein ACFL6Q_02250 [Candidatus Neomarinimicrobiota bacterium]
MLATVFSQGIRANALNNSTLVSQKEDDIQSTPIETSIDSRLDSKETMLLDSTVVALRAQLKLMKRYDDRLLATVYWALGAVGTIFIIIIGLGWYTNFRIYKRDIAAIRAEFESLIKKETSEIRQNLNEYLSKEVEKATARVKELSKGDLNQLQQGLESEVNRLRSEFRWLEIKMTHNEVVDWEKQGVFSNALRALADIIPMAVGTRHEWYVEDVVLADIQRILSQWDKKDPDVIVKLTENIDKLPEKYATVVRIIKTMCES